MSEAARKRPECAWFRVAWPESLGSYIRGGLSGVADRPYGNLEKSSVMQNKEKSVLVQEIERKKKYVCLLLVTGQDKKHVSCHCHCQHLVRGQWKTRPAPGFTMARRRPQFGIMWVDTRDKATRTKNENKKGLDLHLKMGQIFTISIIWRFWAVGLFLAWQRMWDNGTVPSKSKICTIHSVWSRKCGHAESSWFIPHFVMIWHLFKK